MTSSAVDASEAVACKDMCYACFDSLLAHFSGEGLKPPSHANYFCPLFVSWENISGDVARLRGCIGSLTPRYLHGGLHEYALHSGTRDRRFQPISAGEIPSLECKVSLLKCYEPADDYLDWEVGVHGLTIEFDDDSRWKRNATYLPEIAKQQGWSKLETIDSLIRK